MKVTKEELERIYRENPNDEAAKILGVSKVTMIKYLKENGIELKGKGGGFAGGKIEVVR